LKGHRLPASRIIEMALIEWFRENS
jgi:hypothetical protein